MERNAFCEMCRFAGSHDFGGGGDGNDGGGGGGGGTETDGDKPGVRRYFGFTLKQYMALGSLALVDFLGFCSMSVMAPTFPKEVNVRSSGILIPRNFFFLSEGLEQLSLNSLKKCARTFYLDSI